MGRPIKKKWFTMKDGSVAGDLTVETAAGLVKIAKQVGTGKFHLADGQIVKLINGVPTAEGEASLQHNGQFVRKIAQYRMYYFDGGHDVWRDRDAALVGVLVPALVAEGEDPVEPAPTAASSVQSTPKKAKKEKEVKVEEPKSQKFDDLDDFQ